MSTQYIFALRDNCAKDAKICYAPYYITLSLIMTVDLNTNALQTCPFMFISLYKNAPTQIIVAAKQ